MNGKIGEFLRFTRLKKKMTIKDLSEKCNLSVGYISQIERGEATPSIVALNRLAKSLNLNIWEVFKNNEAGTDKYQLDQEFAQPNEIVNQVSLETYSIAAFARDIKVVRKGSRRSIILPHSNLRYSMLTPDLNWKIQMLYVEAEQGAISGPEWLVHEGEECCFVLNGSCEFEIGPHKFSLESGDSISFPCTIRHRWKNDGDEKLVLILCVTPPSL